MEQKKIEKNWGYVYEGRIYLHASKVPKPGLLKFYSSLELSFNSLEIPDGKCYYEIYEEYNPHPTRGVSHHTFAEPILEWGKIK